MSESITLNPSIGAGPMPTIPISPAGAWAFGGSRSLSPAGLAFAQSAASWLLSVAPLVVVGCSRGADAALMRQALEQNLARRVCVRTIFGPFTQNGRAIAAAGAAPSSDVNAVARILKQGGKIISLAGGPLGLDLPTRLANRTRAVALSASSGGVIVCENAWGRGSSLLARSLLARSLPVFAMAAPGTALGAPPFGHRWSLATPAGWLGAPVWFHPGLLSVSGLPIAA